MAAESAGNDAQARLRELLSPVHAEREPNDAGYLDLLPDDLESTGFTQNLMVTRIVPAIYERYWRPALSQVAKGLTGPGMAEEVRIARLLLGLGEGETVLDLACGPGNFSREFGNIVGPGGLVAGLDASRTMLERGAEENRRAGARNVALIRGDATALPFTDASFDAACCFAALHLFADPFAALDEMTRVLSRGGRIAIMTSVRRRLTVRPLKPVLERSSGMRVFEADEITGALEERGFTGIHQRLAGMVQFVGGRLAGSPN
jgi:ubiquinone/menaquinone biosynthesis C-methylase UbiE